MIAFNGLEGVAVGAAASDTGTTGNRIQSNAIYSNARLGIDLGANGFSLNDALDGDTGPNNLQNFPVIISSTPGATTQITGRFNSRPNTTYTLDFYANTAADPSGFGVGQRYLGAATVTTDGAGNVRFTIVVPGASAAGEVITATATDPDGNTSEFSGNRPPTPSADGPYTIAEGQGVTLNASASSDADPDDTLAYSWDVNGDGVFGDAVGVNPSLTWAQLNPLGINDGPQAFKVRVRVDDDAGHVITSPASTLTVTNVAPTAVLSNNGPVDEGSPAIVSFSGQFDPWSADTAAGFHYSFALSQAGLAGSYGTAGEASSAPFTFDDNGSYTVYGRIFDKDGGYTDYSTTVIVNNVPPTALDDSAVTDEDHAVHVSVLANDSDPAGALDPLQIVSVTNGSKGTTSIDTKGTADTTDDDIVYTPNLGATGSDSFSYTISDGDGGTATATVTVQIRNLVDVSGRVFDDLNNDGVYEPGDGEAGIGGVSVQLLSDTALIATQTTAADGTYFFDVNLGAGTYKIVAALPAGFLDGRETAGNLGGVVDNSQDSNQITGISVGAPGTTADAVDYLFAKIRPSRAIGLVWSDFNNDGQVDFGETAIQGVAVTLTGLDDRGNAVSRSVTTDANGIYAFINLRPSNAAGYTIHESQPSGFLDGIDSLGKVNGVTVGDASINDPSPPWCCRAQIRLLRITTSASGRLPTAAWPTARQRPSVTGRTTTAGA